MTMKMLRAEVLIATFLERAAVQGALCHDDEVEIEVETEADDALVVAEMRLENKRVVVAVEDEIPLVPRKHRKSWMLRWTITLAETAPQAMSQSPLPQLQLPQSQQTTST